MNDDLQRQYLIDVIGLSPEEIYSLQKRRMALDYYPRTFQQHLRNFIAKHTQLIGEEAYLLKPRFPRQYLEYIPKDERVLFCTFLALTVLLEQTMYSHFTETYPVFKKKTEPILRVKYGLTWVHANPWVLLICKPSKDQFKKCARTFLAHAKNIFSTSDMPVWANVQKSIEGDPDVRKAVFGEWFCSELNAALRITINKRDALDA